MIAAAHSFNDRIALAAAARGRVLETASNAHLVAVLANAAKPWMRHDYAPRVRVCEQLAKHLAMHPDMLARGLDHVFGVVTPESLAGLLAEAEDPAALEHAVVGTGGRRARLLGPPAVLYVLAGNVPGLGIPPIVASLLARSVAVIRDSKRQPWLTEAFVAEIAEHDADVAALIVTEQWQAGDAGREREAFDYASRVELYGSAHTLRIIRERRRGARARIIERGTRTSAGLVADGAGDECAEGFAEDVALYDGLGCLTPHAILVEGGMARALRFAEALGAALEALERRWPRQPRDFALEAERRAFVANAEARTLYPGGGLLLRGECDAWAVHCSDTATVEDGVGLRCVRVIACGGRDRALELLEGASTPLAAVGLARAGTAAERGALEIRLRKLGATLVCDPGQMQAPPLGWPQDGRPRLGDLLSWQAAA